MYILNFTTTPPDSRKTEVWRGIQFLGVKRGILKNEEEIFFGKVPGNIHTKFHKTSSIIRKHGISREFPPGGERGVIQKIKKRIFLGRCRVTYKPNFITIHQHLGNIDFFLGGVPHWRKTRGISKDKEENLFGKVPGNIHTKFYYIPSIFKKYGVLENIPPPPGGGNWLNFWKTEKTSPGESTKEHLYQILLKSNSI